VALQIIYADWVYEGNSIIYCYDTIHQKLDILPSFSIYSDTTLPPNAMYYLDLTYDKETFAKTVRILPFTAEKE